ncbi:uncharacterized protein LOC132718062 isoform X2 [Ruditapes philippinarum]|uniref:uncharacterized protein LOC132718062 isoform X2 n=1 Tax=Ruditapes philippinarum TaxID=129788 RepID=UPI00295B5D65|nr:uncharacterized protein LOC132718062 isoform X2 [Ruditapes philippinarum]
MSTKNYETIVEDVKAGHISNIQHLLEISKENQLLQQEKKDLKNSFFYQEKKRLYLEYLGKERNTWPSVEKTGERLKASREEWLKVKDRLDEEKDKVYNILEKVTEEHNLLLGKVKTLENKQELFEEKKKSCESRRQLDPSLTETAISKCKHAIGTIEEEVAKLKVEIENREQEICRLKTMLDGKTYTRSNNCDDKKIERLRNIVSFLEEVNGLTVHVSGQKQLTLVFNQNNSELTRLTSPEDSLNLEITLTFNTTCEDVRLCDVKINVDHFEISDIVDTAIAMNDVPYLVLSVQNRWNQHFPLLSEMDILNKNHAIDWIQEQCRLRVLVGKCGKIMFTLHVPKDYPSTREITLLDYYGLDDVDTEKLPDKSSTLLEWVLYLENTYGDC